MPIAVTCEFIPICGGESTMPWIDWKYTAYSGFESRVLNGVITVVWLPIDVLYAIGLTVCNVASYVWTYTLALYGILLFVILFVLLYPFRFVYIYMYPEPEPEQAPDSRV